jgi:hypothetical protein
MVSTDINQDNAKVEESVIAKSTGGQEEKDKVSKDAALYHVLGSHKKMTKEQAGYSEQEEKDATNENEWSGQGKQNSCVKCKFNLPDEKKCHVVEGVISNDRGISKFFSPKGDGMLPGDIVWDYIKKTGRKLEYEEGDPIANGAEGFQCKDCKYYMYSDRCLLIKGSFTPEMSCAFVVKIGNGVEI